MKLSCSCLLNILWFICSLPIFTIGASTTALYYACLKVIRDEESHAWELFFRSFKENFKQGVILQAIKFTVAGILFLDYILMLGRNTIYGYIVIAFSLILYMASLYTFPLLSKFVNTIFGTVKNSFLMAVLALPKTILMAVVTGIPLLILYFFDLRAVPVLILVGIAGPGYLLAMLYNKTFKRFEPKEEEQSEEEELDAAIRKIDEGLENDTEKE